MKYITVLNELLKRNDVLIACHQGSAGGNIAYNTYKSMVNAINQGANIVEFDVSKTSDNIFYVFHENEEPIRFNRDEQFRTFTAKEIKEQFILNMNMLPVETPPTLKDFMENMKKHPDVLLHFDHVQKWGKELLEELDQYEEQRNTIIIKTDVDATDCLEALAAHEVKYMTLPKVWNQEDFNKIMEYEGKINIVGFEMIFDDPTVKYVSKENLDKLRELGYHTMINAIVLGGNYQTLCGGFDDDISLLKNPDLGWGKLVEMGFDVIQTDWPLPLRNYMEGKMKRKE